MTEKRFVVFVPKQTGRDDFRLVDSCDRLLHNNKTDKFHKLTYVSIRSISETVTWSPNNTFFPARLRFPFCSDFWMYHRNIFEKWRFLSHLIISFYNQCANENSVLKKRCLTQRCELMPTKHKFYEILAN